MINPLSRIMTRRAVRNKAASLLEIEQLLAEARMRLMQETETMTPDTSRIAELERRLEAAFERIAALEERVGELSPRWMKRGPEPLIKTRVLDGEMPEPRTEQFGKFGVE
jgi:hypothetical protein